MKGKRIIQLLMPPLMLGFARWLNGTLRRLLGLGSSIEYEYISGGWSYSRAHPEVKGWNVPSVLETHKRQWEAFKSLAEGKGPLGVSHEAKLDTNTDLGQHNTIMVFAYSLTLASRRLDSISVLDWGGGIGQYYVLAKALVPDLRIDYHCREVPQLAQYGAQLFPEQHFYKDDSCFQRSYDFVLASSSLQYSEDWEMVLARLVGVTRGYLLLTRLPTVDNVPSFVFLQRPYTFGYNTEYLGWCLNRQSLLTEAQERGLTLIREFVVAERPYIFRAPEQCRYKGFLFKSDQ
jgi:putative methyltransferase (TIGR04325 family)